MPAFDATSFLDAEVVLPGAPLPETLAFFTRELGFRLEIIFPADDPAVAVISGHGLRIRLDIAAAGDPGTLRLSGRDLAVNAIANSLTAPNGTYIDVIPAAPELDVPPLQPALVVSRIADGEDWVTGRAGMQYRDLIPGRLGGRFIASHIRIPDGGPVPDMVHYHRVRFQMIYCVAGWVRVVYEDQGPSMLMRAGDCFLQPPGIRHRVLESSPGLQVLEIGCPAEHETLIDHDLTLPSDGIDPERDFGGQRFVFFEADSADWHASDLPGLQYCDLGIAAATGGLASVRTIRPVGGPSKARFGSDGHDGEFRFYFLAAGKVAFESDRQPATPLAAGDSVALPPALPFVFSAFGADTEILEIALPAESRGVK